jgi:hypothetical protein
MHSNRDASLYALVTLCLVLQVLRGLDPRGAAALLCTCRLLLEFQDRQAGDIWCGSWLAQFQEQQP